MTCRAIWVGFWVQGLGLKVLKALGLAVLGVLGCIGPSGESHGEEHAK